MTLSRDARARAVQLPAWNEALGLPRPWDQQWSLRLQQVLAFETDLLEYEDLFTGSVVVEQKVAELVEGARAEMARVRGAGRRGRGRRVRLHEERAGRLAGRAAPADRERRGRRRRRQPVRDHRAQPADRRPRRRDHGRRPGGGGTPRRRPCGRGGPSATRTPVDEALDAPARGGRHRRQPHGRHPRLRPRRRDDGGVGRRAARGVRRVPRADRRRRGAAPAARPTRR